MIRVLVSGAAGRMGQEVLRAVHKTEGMELVGAVDLIKEDVDIGTLIGIGEIGIPLKNDLEEVIATVKPDVIVDFTNPDVVFNNVKLALKYGVRPVVGTTGMGRKELTEIEGLCQSAGVGCIVAPNFAIGALLMIKFATEAAKYLPHVEIIELHHDQKIDAPSGTAIKTAESIVQTRGDFRQGLATEIEKIPGARGGEFEGGIRIHSVRLPGYVAHQEVIFGGVGQTLTIRHDSISRESFMPGVVLAVQKVMYLDRFVYGLENILFE
ncbi:4-hydroxy-tetrahydrodipicolinate reductase [Desulfolucanica intricata]|uniref:4-hydroxy-tetrahydrodipicolinate reductase n=1 Tax=Desulfolucanica intricata TaxID=1285191 RepID=UPI0008337764|nr:4-hydroxy-tetrahydrodipicolinate reductase [Desulfolucanica intricata]